jgi:RND family efflux transporter MFP subunit
VIAGGTVWFETGMSLPFSDSTGGDDSEKAENAIPVHVTAVRKADVPVTFRYTGVAKSPEIVELKARVTGSIMQRPFKPGGPVRKGDLLFQIDPRPFAAALADATAQRAQAAADARYYATEVGRYTKLANRGFASEERLDMAQRNQATAEAKINQAEAQMMTDRLDIDYASVQAPFDGRAGITDVNVGDVVTASTSRLVGLARIDPIDVQVALSSADLAAVRAATAAGHTPDFQLVDANGKATGRTARIYQYDDTVDPSTARLLVRATMPNPDASLVPGDFVRVRLRTGTEQRLLVPTVALSSDLDQQIVFAVKNGTVEAQPVQTGAVFGDRTAILSGLEPGAVIAVDNIQRLHSGAAVAVDHHGNDHDGDADDSSNPGGGAPAGKG